jgi:hypothetical protein
LNRNYSPDSIDARFSQTSDEAKTRQPSHASQKLSCFAEELQWNIATAQHNLRRLYQKAGLSRFGPAGCLTEQGIVHQGVAHHEKARSGLYCATP